MDSDESTAQWDAQETLMELLAGLPDPRLDHNRRHKLVDMLAIAICGALCGVDNYVELERFARIKHSWLSTFLELPSGIPSHDTFGRLFAALDREAFATMFARWLSSWGQELQGAHIAIDGKAIRAAVDRSAKSCALLMVSAFAVDSGLVLGQVQTEPDSNEIEAVPKLLQQLQLKGKIVTLDALHCQSHTAQLLHDAGAHYALCVKGNQPQLHKALSDHLRIRRAELVQQDPACLVETLDKQHGRLETRRYFINDEVKDLSLSHLQLDTRWPGANVLGCVERERLDLRTGKSSTELTVYIASLPRVDVQLFASSVRAHWGIENKLHWVLDVAFNEDRSTARTKHAAHNYALIRKVALNLLRNDPDKAGMKCKRKMCGWDHAYLLSVLQGRASSPGLRASR